MDTKKLRQKILDLAIRGKLVPQDPNDEPASVLLERIRAEKERLIKEGKVKRSKKVAADDEIEAPFEIPESWEWCKLDDLAFYKKGPFGSSLTKSMFVPDAPSVYKVYEQKNAINKDATLGHYFIDCEKYEELKGFAVLPSDIIVSCAGTIGETYILPHGIREGIINQALMLIRLYDTSITYFYLLYFDYILKKEAAKESKGTAIKNIPPFEVLKNFQMPIPPLAEQQRIANEVKRWFALIDELESNEGDLLKAIDKTKTKILDLAIHGKLVPQDPNDEPASVLLDKIRKEKAQLVKEGKLKKKDIVETPISEDEKPFEIPESWERVRLGDYANKVTDFVASGSFASLRENVKYYKEANYALLVKTKDFQSNFEKDLTYTDEHGYKYLENSNLFGGELILSNVGSIGKIFIVPKLDKKMSLAPNAIMIRLRNEHHRDWLYYFFQSEAGISMLYGISSATAIRKFNKTDFKKLAIPLPPLAEQLRIVAKIEELFAVLDRIKESLE